MNVAGDRRGRKVRWLTRGRIDRVGEGAEAGVRVEARKRDDVLPARDVVVLRIRGRQVDEHVLGRVDLQVAAQGITVGAMRGASGGRHIEGRARLDITVGDLPATGKPAAHRVGKAAAHRAFDAVGAELGRARLEVAVRLVFLGLARQEMNQPAGRVAAEQGPLRSAQHLDAIHVEELRVDRVHAGDVSAIHVHGHRRLEVVLEVVLRDTTQAEHRERR